VRILVVEDEVPIREGLLDRLGREGFEAAGAPDGETALRLAAEAPFDLVLLDLMLPGIEGVEVLDRLRRHGDETPVIVVSARAGEADRVLLLDRGADDYVVKPFSVRELVSRIRAVLRRRPAAAPPGPVAVGEARVDLDARRVTRGGEVFPLTATERGMLALLLRHRGYPVSREEFLREVWGYDRLPDTRTVDFHVVRLRRKIETDPENPRWLKTVRGAGFVLEPERGA
jgi:DNA-binding response OmpR family regulator